MATTEKCTHENTTTGPAYGFSGPVATREEFTNRAAHGNITFVETCRRCGAERHVNQNQRHVETGPWGPDKATRDRIERQKQDRLEREREAAEDAAMAEAGIKVLERNEQDGCHAMIVVERRAHSRSIPERQIVPEWKCREAAQADDSVGAVYRAILRHAEQLA